jgi:hypothetical protein
MGKKLPDNVHDLAWRIGFQNHSIPGTQRSDRSQRIRPPSRVDDRQRWMMLTQQVRDIDTVSLSWHVDVGDQQGERLWRVLDQDGGIVARGRLTDVVPAGGQRFHENITNQYFIFYNQNTHNQVSLRALPNPHQGNGDLLSFRD